MIVILTLILTNNKKKNNNRSNPAAGRWAGGTPQAWPGSVAQLPESIPGLGALDSCAQAALAAELPAWLLSCLPGWLPGC